MSRGGLPSTLEIRPSCFVRADPEACWCLSLKEHASRRCGNRPRSPRGNCPRIPKEDRHRHGDGPREFTFTATGCERCGTLTLAGTRAHRNPTPGAPASCARRGTRERGPRAVIVASHRVPESTDKTVTVGLRALSNIDGGRHQRLTPKPNAWCPSIPRPVGPVNVNRKPSPRPIRVRE